MLVQSLEFVGRTSLLQALREPSCTHAPDAAEYLSVRTAILISSILQLFFSLLSILEDWFGEDKALGERV